MGSFTPHGYTPEMAKLYHACAALGMGPRASRTVAEWTESLEDAASKPEEFWVAKHGCGPHTASEIMAHLAVRDVEKPKAVSPTSIPDAHDINGKIWFRKSTDEWVLELNGSINDTGFCSRHTAPKGTAPEDVAGLMHLYDEPKETIVAVAIEIEGLCISLPQPARHGHVHMAAEACGIEPDVYLRGTQGFLTNTGRFVNRVMAKHIAHRAGQPQMRPLEDRHQRDLFSEDLW